MPHNNEQRRTRKERRDIAMAIVLALATFVLTFFLKVEIAGIAAFVALIFLASFVGNTERFAHASKRRIRTTQAVIVVIGSALLTVILYPYWREEKAAVLSGVLCGSQGLPTDHPRFKLWEAGPIIEGKDNTPQIAQMPEGAKLFIHRSPSGELLVDTEVLDRNGNLVVEVKNNRWSVSSSQADCWDKNYSKNTLEVKDGRGRVVLQIRFHSNWVTISGEWWAKDGNRLRITNGQLVFMVAPFFHPDEPHIEPMFLYPSREHWSEFAEH